MEFRTNHHYVPVWYQRRFLAAGQSKFHVLDKHPDPIHTPSGVKHHNAVRRAGPASTFCLDHLYTLFQGEAYTDIIESQFFADIDFHGSRAIAFFDDYQIKDGVNEALGAFSKYLAAQFFRTLKGLHFLRVVTRTTTHQQALQRLPQLYRQLETMWLASVWEIICADECEEKFIVSDCPVTAYNREIYPGSREVANLGTPSPVRVGTQTFFPLSPTRCLVMTHLQYVRNPKGSPVRRIENPRVYEDSLFDLRKIQRGRQVDGAYVQSVNYVLKVMAQRYIASSNVAWLYPENTVGTTPWPSIGGRTFLMPDPRLVPFTTGVVARFDDGRGMALNEYGHRQADNDRAKALRAKEWKTFQASKRAWDDRDKREGRPPPDLVAWERM
ncbi:Protein of unknown function [Luteibacter sp. UNC138MFCol5.1]|uniref:DUF4238 domain-containing protein n=1 Tax=Luteibacter sp. UNC138MFCol5.1 TaxID=1502774 RepID=UPI0008D8AD82|nr:DUF4238 domain-containing protein [Luteibacter sp. UNC138MFCol5.1]SEO93879.1 Protein of unknown function [Luteibacter sp. UNC138MFCol5.1]